MEKPKTVPENVWEAVCVVAAALQRKFETPLAIPAGARLGNATTNQLLTGGCDAGYQDCDAPAGGTGPDGLE